MFTVRYRRVFERALVVEVTLDDEHPDRDFFVECNGYMIKYGDVTLIGKKSFSVSSYKKNSSACYWFESASEREEWITNIVPLIDKLNYDNPPIVLACYNTGKTGLAIQITHMDESLRGAGLLGKAEGYSIQSCEQPLMLDNALFVWGRLNKKDDAIVFHDFESTHERENWKKAIEMIITNIRIAKDNAK